ncbi:MAG: sugar phosphate isomerase/epimerase [Succinatimonas sp.]|nr:sugar phosphate isomerase/epimerase [Succinatimonas sp.]
MKLAVSTVCFDGYDLETSFKCLKEMNVKNVEIAYIDGYIPFKEEDLTPKKGQEINALLNKYDLTPTTVGAHIDFGAKDAVERISRRIIFTKNIGAPIVISNSCFIEDEEQIICNINQDNAIAKEHNIIIALENTGFQRKTLCSDAKTLSDLIIKLNLSHVKANYDTANVVTHYWENINELKNLHKLNDVMCCLHLKDTRPTATGCYQMCNVGTGVVNNKEYLNYFKNLEIVVTLEMPMRISWDSNHQLAKQKDPLPLKDICDKVNYSYQWAKNLIEGL